MHVYILENSGSPHDAGILSIIEVINHLNINHTILLGRKNYKNFEKINNKKLNIQRISILFFIKLKIFSKEKYSIIYNTTSTKNALFNMILSIMFWGKNIYYIRNANSWIKYNQSEKFYYSILRFIVFFAKKIMLKTRKFLCVEKETIKKFLNNNGYNDIMVIPFIFFKNENLLSQNVEEKVYTVTCPGVVDLSRKNMILIYNSIKHLLQVRNDLKLVFLGRPKTEKDKIFCEKLKEELKEKFVYFNNYINEEEYKEYTEHSDIIIGSYYINHKCEYFEEIYGTTKGSGVDAHAISSAKVLLVNSDYEVDDAYRTSTLKFKDEEELSFLISKYIDDINWRKNLESLAVINAQNYHVSNFVDKFKEVVLK